MEKNGPDPKVIGKKVRIIKCAATIHGGDSPFCICEFVGKVVVIETNPNRTHGSDAPYSILGN